MPRRHVEIAPDRRKIFFPDAEKVDALAAGDLHRRDLVFLDHVRDAPKLGRIRDTAPYPRNDGERAVFLYVRVRALVDEARLWIVLRFVRPGRDEIVVERRTARRAAIRRSPAQHPYRF